MRNITTLVGIARGENGKILEPNESLLRDEYIGWV